MVSGRNNLKRRIGTRKRGRTVSIYCEGKTEEQYFTQVRTDLRARSFRVEMVPGPGNAYDIVRYAIQDTSANDRLAGDQVWCVFDIEAPKPRLKIVEAIELAEQNKISCAVSNPCFEIWPLLHFIDHCGYLATSHKACQQLAKVLPAYTTRRKKIDYDAFQALKPGYPTAKRRAAALESRYDGSVRLEDRNPSTSVWRLMEALDALYPS